ncbi:MAG: hydrogenase expression/formation protein HypE [Rubrivivax sp.]|jgi:hydrogenase expression/formation protein HypE|nr:hydrogenase expression/formation protein HypE [Rubrivivax sp.]
MATLRDKSITMAHGGGGRAMRELIDKLIVPAFDNPKLAALEDQACVGLAGLAEHGDRLAFTTDSYVVAPLFFAGGDIGKLAICGTVNDLAMAGAVPLYLSCGLIIEEGFATSDLERVLASMSITAQAAGVQVVTGDTKVVNRGAADKLFINTAGIGVVPRGVNISATRARPGDVVIVNGSLGDHGVAILVARNELELHSSIASDCQPLHGLVQAMLAACPDIHCLRDATRGGLATVLNEFAVSSQVGIRLQERALPIKPEVRGATEMLGLDVLYMANEGKLVAVVPRSHAAAVLAAMRAHSAGADAAIVGEVLAEPAGHVVLNTAFGGERVVDMLVGEQLPRIC